MHLFDKMKHIAATTITVLAVSVIATTGLNVQAAEIETKTKTHNYGVYEVGSEISVYGATNLKINGKKYTKGSIKKKIKTIQTDKNVDYVDNQSAYIEYFDLDNNSDTINENIPDLEDYKQQKEENYKRIYMHNYQLTFLKTGKYTISYDQYTTKESKKVKNADGISYTVTPVLEKTTVKEKYKVLKTTNVFKSIKLGKTKYTYSTKKANSGAKTTRKTTITNRYLKGNSGRLVFTVSDKKTYSFNNALVVTRDANGVLAFSVVGNTSTVAYSTGVYSNVTTYEKINQDTNGNVIDATTGKPVKTTDTISQTTSKYKETTVYYGYKNKFTGDYLSYAVDSTTVYVPRKESAAKNADYIKQEVTVDGITEEKYILDSVPATVITRTYPQQVAKYDVTTGTASYKTVTVAEQKVVLSTDKTMNEYNLYYTDAEGKNYAMSGSWDVVSMDEIPVYVKNANGDVYYNPAYKMAFDFYAEEYDYEQKEWVQRYYEGSWVEDKEYNINITNYSQVCFTQDAQGTNTRWVYQYKYGTYNDKCELENNNIIDGLGDQIYNRQIFYAK